MSANVVGAQGDLWDNGDSKTPASARTDRGRDRPEGVDMSTVPEPTSVYRYYDAHGLLLYVGVTSRGAARNGEHNKGKAWWPFVVRQEVEHHPSRPSALSRETALIRRYGPPFNTVHNPSHELTRAAYLQFRQAKGRTSDLLTALPERNRVDMEVAQAGRHLTLCYAGGMARSVAPQSAPFPISGARFEEFGHEGERIIVRATIKGKRRVKGARLMFKVESQKPLRMSVKRIDLRIFGEVA